MKHIVSVRHIVSEILLGVRTGGEGVGSFENSLAVLKTTLVYELGKNPKFPNRDYD